MLLLGRNEERLALDRLLAQALDGRSGALALVGEPGIGKTALLDHAAERAQGMRVLRARGVESEAVIPFAGLSELLHPLLGALDRIPPPQARALAGALALGPARAGDRFAVGAATLSLLSASAEEEPLVLLVDDAHWLDRPSAETLLFAARRLLADPIAIVLSAREGQPSLLNGADLRTLRVAGLDRSHAAELLSSMGVADAAVARLYGATGGNPLALRELASADTDPAGVPGALPIPISTSIGTSFLARFGGLPESTRRMLVLVAASDVRTLAVLARAAADIGLDVSDLAAAEQAGLVTIGPGEVEFSHPLARTAMYADASAQERREAHAALAGALPDRDSDRRAWHMAAASAGPDDQASDALEQAGVRAHERSAYAVAAAAFERAAGLASLDDARDRLLLAAADAAWLAGDAQRALALLDRAQAYLPAPIVAARIDYLRGRIAMRCGPVEDGYPLVVGAARQIADTDPELAVAMLAQAVHGCLYTCDTPAMIAAAEFAVELAGRQESYRAKFLATMAQGIALVADGQGEAGAASARRAVEILERSEELREDPELLVWAAFGPLWLREAGTGRRLIEQASERVRVQAALGSLPYLLHLLARDQATTDRWSAAEASYDEAIRLGRETGQRVEVAAALAGLAWLEARQGRADRCREHAAEAMKMCDELGLGLFGVWAIQALGDLELGLGRPAAAIEHHLTQAQALRSSGIADVDLSPAPELVEALLRLGRHEQAAALAVDFAAQAVAKGQSWALARAARCRGLLADTGEMEFFEEALELHGRTPDAFETARTHLAYGACLRRARKRVLAREQLRSAIEIFERLGAQPWFEQARAELAATGETAHSRKASTLDDLTPQELRIARLLCEGKTTREVAAAIFVSPKTVEYHLGHVYRKLGIHSREELLAAFGPTDGALRPAGSPAR